ncbi:MAG: starch-binding protein [Ruminococcus sp.]
MKIKKKHTLRMLSLLLSLILTVSCLSLAGVATVSAAEYNIYLRGSMNGWNCYEEYKFVNEGNNIYTLVIFMTGNEYEYKVGDPNWNVGLGDPGDNRNNAIIDLDKDSIVKFTADLNRNKQYYEIMNEKSDFTFSDKALTIEAESYTFALGSVSVLSDSKASNGKYVGNFDKGDSLSYGVTVSGTKPQTYRFTVSVASENDNGEFSFVTGTESTKANFLTTGAWQSYKSLVFTKSLNPGYNRITIENTFGTYNVDKIQIDPVSEAADSIAKGETTLSFAGFDSASDTAIVKDGKIENAKAGDYVSVIVKPVQSGVYQAALSGTEFPEPPVSEPDDKILLGDADLDGKVNVKDATAIQKQVANIITFDDTATLCADADLDGRVNVKDATVIQKFIAGIEVDTPIDEYISLGAKAKSVTSAVKLGTDRASMTALTEENPYATLVLDGETEIFVEVLTDGFSAEGLAFNYIPNIELMGYTASCAEDDSTVTRFDSDYDVTSVTVTAVGDSIGGATVILSDGTSKQITDISKGEKKAVTFDSAHTVRWVKILTNEPVVYEIIGEKKASAESEQDIALQGYVSTSEGWQKACEYPYTVLTSKQFGIGFDKEATVDKVTFISTTGDIPEKVTVTTASGEKKELTGTAENNNAQYTRTFDLGSLNSFGFFFEFDKNVTVNMIRAQGDTSYKGASVNVSDALDYELFTNGLTENDSRVVANTGTHILSSETGSDREWTLTEDISGSPSFYAPNTPLAEAAYNLTMEEIYKSINYDSTFGDVFYTGTNWQKVWTRDTAISMQYILSWLFPEISTNCAEAKVVGKDGNLTFEEDTGTGGSYPVSTDRIIMMLAVWETYLADGNLDTLEYFYNVASNTIKQDYEVVFDEESGLFKGETCGLDHRDKTYGDWTGEDDENGIVNIAEGKATSTNIIFCQVMKILSESAAILGKGEAESKAWADLASELEEAISARLWHDELGTYAAWEYPGFMGSPLSYKQDVLGNGYAVWYNIGTEEQINSIMENYTLVNFGANTVYPQKDAERWTGYKYHDSGVWPGWEAILMIGAANNENENNLLAEEIWNSCVRGAVACLTNYEVIDYETGEGLHSTQQLWSVAATMAGYFRVLYGMEYTTEGITFDPYVPDWMEGPFTVTNYKYRDANLTMHLEGKGDTISSVFVNGEDMTGKTVIVPADAKGDYEIVIKLKDSGAVDAVNLKAENTAKAPKAPSVTNTNGKLTWTSVANCTYKVWTGSEYVDVTGNTYTIDTTKYGCYSVVAVDKTTGLWSELSKPISYNPDGSKVTVSVGDHTDNASNSKPLTISMTTPVDGVYQMSVIHTNLGDPTAGITAAIRSVYVDGKEAGTLTFPAMSFGHQISSHIRLNLTAGAHEVVIKYGNENWYDRNMSQVHGQNNNNVTYHMVQFELTDGDFSAIEPPAKKTVYFTNNKDWSTVKIFFWGGSDSTSWPGESMTYVGKDGDGKDVYSYSLDPSTPNIIFNNGNGGGSNQTVDIVEGVEDMTGFYLNGTGAEGKWTVGRYTYTP